MSEKEIKFTEDELKSLGELRDSYASTQLALGQLEVQRMILNQQLESLDNEKLKLETQYKGVQTTESKLVNDLNEKYGAGNLDPQTGVFTPTK
jgi:hypothetical protein|tara:strand:- start:2600 stop:2878 length:279 start_codon:yes stop_codon:yes gene_type:complete